MTWHSIIKGKTLEILTWFYNIGKHRSDTENQSEAQMLIRGAVFLRDSVDAEGSTNNMAHPALAALITDFFYAPLSLNIAFPEVFSCEVPKVAVCLVATALRAALDKYTQTGTCQDHPFEYIGYSRVFAGLLDMQHQLDLVLKHASKMKALHIAWATSGR
ncbi:hypothetical protein PISMIDRAFT_116456 [Pisolithus microcarpus 441]|uniref:DUF6532 domain-containing protein n=1 Tax=Pisolithus microcarpus 441 TaxID=765257 RepID=A0A0C9Z3Y0_9AGAM|nr:hypothetical protein BKA83DRAFT_116456 [Pisolithus microcarpus]KIK14738.1 hypothetical protein PISMIDRAFT_116456 [Pisolithus microcarpus 441]